MNFLYFAMYTKVLQIFDGTVGNPTELSSPWSRKLLDMNYRNFKVTLLKSVLDTFYKIFEGHIPLTKS